MPRRIVIIQGHPDPAPERLCRGLAAAYAQAARAAGHHVDEVDVAALDFPMLRTAEDYQRGRTPAALEGARDAILAADHVMIVFPLWLGTMPALLKAFLEQVMRPGTAFAYQEKGFPKTLLKGKSARVVVTMGMPAFLYRWFYFAHGVRGLERSILGFVGLRPIRETLIGMVEGASPQKRAGWLDKMRDLGGKGV